MIVRLKEENIDYDKSEAINTRGIILDDVEIKMAENYFFQKSTQEVKQFNKPQVYQNISKEVDGILRFSGRILQGDHVKNVTNLTAVMKDLVDTTFCVPVIDRFSPIAYSIVSDYHWNNECIKHSGIESTLREISKYVFIIEGRSIVKKVKKSCERCRYLEKKNN